MVSFDQNLVQRYNCGSHIFTTGSSESQSLNLGLFLFVRFSKDVSIVFTKVLTHFDSRVLLMKFGIV